MDICKAIHEAIGREIREGREPIAIILSFQAYTYLKLTFQDIHHVEKVDISTFEGLSVFMVPEDKFSMPGKDFWIKIAVRPY
ncbi:MAG: hypothetical protein WC294_10265 [Methanoregula sp.]|jgi:hypothetical protein